MEDGKKTRVMGIVNVTPDSFSDGGKYFRPEQGGLILLVTDFLIITLSYENRLVKT